MSKSSPVFRRFHSYLTGLSQPVYNERNCGRKTCCFIPVQKGVWSLAGGKKIWIFLLRFFGFTVFVALLVLLAATLILAKPQENKATATTAQASANARPAISIDQENDLIQLVSDFPAPVMSYMGGSGMTFVSATSSDMAVSGGFGRIATLYWQTPEGEPVTLQSIWPADALSLLENSYHFMPYAGPALFGSTSVRMEKDDSVRLHVTTDQALYVVLLPRSLSEKANDLCRSLQLFTAAPQG